MIDEQLDIFDVPVSSKEEEGSEIRLSRSLSRVYGMVAKGGEHFTTDEGEKIRILTIDNQKAMAMAKQRISAIAFTNQMGRRYAQPGTLKLTGENE